MMNTPIYDIIHSSGVSKTYRSKLSHSISVQTPSHEDSANYDQVSISSDQTGLNRFRQEMVSRLSQEIRTATTTGKLQELHQAIADGSYHPDPAKIAKSILNQWEA